MKKTKHTRDVIVRVASLSVHTLHTTNAVGGATLHALIPVQLVGAEKIGNFLS